MQHFTFLTPQAADASSSAAAYTRGLVAALRALGHTVDISAHAGNFPGRVIIDAILLKHCPVELLTSPAATLLVHHVPSPPQDIPARIIASNAPTADRLADAWPIDRGRVAVITPGAADAPRGVGSGGKGCAILSVGALVERKRHDVLLRALAGLPDLDWRLTIVGSGTADPAHAASLAALAQALEISPRVHFTGAVDQPTLEMLWQKADLFALASRWEGYAMAASEALRRGVPAVVSNGGAAGDLTPPEAGAVCPAGDQADATTAFTKALRRLIFDLDLRQMMADGAFEAGRALPSWETQAARFVEATQ